jgi:cytochrome c biogenesis protein CcmG/thiol:disulfide interchange protein DsbE
MTAVRGVQVALFLATTLLLRPATTSFASERIPAVAPDFTRTDLKGIPLFLRSFRGKLVLLNFWATWCGPCLTEIPQFVAWQNTYGAAGLQIVGVSMDDSAAPVKRAYDKYRLNYPVVMGDADLGESFGGVLGLPLSFLIDPSGRIAGRYQGEPDLKKLEAQIKSLLPSQQSVRKASAP